MTDSYKRPIRKAIFPVAGLGTRFLPATKVMPKEMLPINDRPLIQHVYEEAREAGIEEFIFVTGRHKNMLEEHFDFQPELENVLLGRGKDAMLEKVRNSEIGAGQLFLTRQPKPLGLGHAVWCAAKLIEDEPFAILLPDMLIQNDVGCLKQMVDVYAQTGGNIIAVEDVPRQETDKYGIVDTGGEDKDTSKKTLNVKALVEKPAPQDAPSTLSVIGRYILQPEVFKHLSSFETGAGGEIQLTDAMAKLIGTQPFTAMKFDGALFDSGSRLGFIQANMAFASKDPEIGADVQRSIIKMAEQLQNNKKD